jgi:dTDP-glucose 4,6-dehydratase/UDP-glucose 4-epimerase
MTYQSKKVLITGGLGFIGSNLAKKLVTLGADVTLLDSLIPEYGGNLFNIVEIEGKVKVNISDIRDNFGIRHIVRGKEYIFNLAGQTSHIDSMIDPVTDLEINAKAQITLLEACRNAGTSPKIVFASTRQLYGKPQYLPVDESHPIRPVDINGINKLAGEWYHSLYDSVYNIPTCSLRLTNTYGPGMRIRDARQTFLGIWIRQIIEKKPISIYGSGDQLRDFNYVDDVVEALLIAGASEAANGKLYNLGGSEVLSLNQVAQSMVVIAEDLGISGAINHQPFPEERRSIDIGDYYGSFEKIRTELGWSPRTSMAEGLKRSIDFFLKFSEFYLN